jgi:hypothetical protein
MACIDDIKKYFKEDHFTFLVVEANELYFGFDLRKAAEFDIAVKIVSKSFLGVGIDGKKTVMALLLAGNLHGYYLDGRRNQIARINLLMIML